MAKNQIIAAQVQASGLLVVRAYTALDRAEGTVREANLEFLAECAKDGMLKKDIPAALRMVGASDQVLNRFKVWCSENSIKADEQGKLVHVTDDKGNIHVTFKPAGELKKKKRAARQATTPPAAPPVDPADGAGKPQSKADKLSEAERGLRVAAEMMRGVALPKECKTVEQATGWILANLSKYAA